MDDEFARHKKALDNQKKLEEITKLVRGHRGLTWGGTGAEYGKSIDSLLDVLKDIDKILEK